ncbi:MAG: sugar phosphate isomerase/epimerase, partial [Candidatus Eremiobacteraeota bacterium]|nr:sugar phosphate isomerase/epimerase [Candidatus Eremiobacteraeota bacterium]
LYDEIRGCGDRIFLVQVSQWQQPRSAADRRNLGEGAIDNAGIIRTLRDAGYTGYYVLEIFSGESLPDSLWRADLDAVLRVNRNVFGLIWEQSAQ